MDISIIIVSFNTKNLLIDCIESLKKEIKKLKNKYPVIKTEIIIVENGSHDVKQSHKHFFIFKW